MYLQFRLTKIDTRVYRFYNFFSISSIMSGFFSTPISYGFFFFSMFDMIYSIKIVFPFPLFSANLPHPLPLRCVLSKIFQLHRLYPVIKFVQ